jgi:hypothetical protein
LFVGARDATWDEHMFKGDRYRNASRYANAAESRRAALSAAGGERHPIYRKALETWLRTRAPDSPEIATEQNLALLDDERKSGSPIHRTVSVPETQKRPGWMPQPSCDSSQSV